MFPRSSNRVFLVVTKYYHSKLFVRFPDTIRIDGRRIFPDFHLEAERLLVWCSLLRLLFDHQRVIGRNARRSSHIRFKLGRGFRIQITTGNSSLFQTYPVCKEDMKRSLLQVDEDTTNRKLFPHLPDAEFGSQSLLQKCRLHTLEDSLGSRSATIRDAHMRRIFLSTGNVWNFISQYLYQRLRQCGTQQLVTIFGQLQLPVLYPTRRYCEGPVSRRQQI